MSLQQLHRSGVDRDKQWNFLCIKLHKCFGSKVWFLNVLFNKMATARESSGYNREIETIKIALQQRTELVGCP